MAKSKTTKKESKGEEKEAKNTKNKASTSKSKEVKAKTVTKKAKEEKTSKEVKSKKAAKTESKGEKEASVKESSGGVDEKKGSIKAQKEDKGTEKKEAKKGLQKAQKEDKGTKGKESGDGDLSMEQLLAMSEYELRVPRRGDVIEGVITEINRRMVLVDIGAKTEGMVVEKEYEETRDLIGDLHVGDTVAVYVSSPENDRGQILLSLKKAAIDRKWEQFSEYMETDHVVKVKGLEVNRGGLIVSAEGLRGFVPSSQFGKDYLGKMDQLLDAEFEVKVIEVDKPKNRLIFSERDVSEAMQIENKNKALEVIDIGGVYKGVVSGIMPFGVFVTVTIPLEKKQTGQVEGLVHISEISWEKVNDPNDFFTQGDRVDVKVLGVDKGKLNLSVKQLSNDPWDTIMDKYEVGTTVRGKVTRVEPFGVFVTLEPGVDGLIHISKIEAGKEPEVGKEIDVVVDSVDTENRRMSLGMVLTEVPVMYK